MLCLQQEKMNSQDSYLLGRRLALATRPWIVQLPLLVYLATLIHNSFSILLAVLGCAMVLIAHGIVTLHNDIADYDIDIENRRQLMLATGRLSYSQMYGLAVALIIASVVVAVLLGGFTLLWLALYVFAGWLYSGPVNVKGHPVGSGVVLAICYGVMPWMLLFAVNQALPPAYIVIATFIFVFGIIQLKDFKDLEGDRKFGKRTLLVRYGPAVVKNVVLGCTLIAYGVLVCQLSILNGLAGLVVGCGLLSIWMLLYLFNHNSATTRKRIGESVRILFYICAVVLYLTR